MRPSTAVFTKYLDEFPLASLASGGIAAAGTDISNPQIAESVAFCLSRICPAAENSFGVLLDRLFHVGCTGL